MTELIAPATLTANLPNIDQSQLFSITIVWVYPALGGGSNLIIIFQMKEITSMDLFFLPVRLSFQGVILCQIYSYPW
jgi:hypothetical protein